MKILLIIGLWLFTPALQWGGNFNQAKEQAQKEHKLIIINFSGSDWCGPCIRLRKEILESSVFEEYAKEHLILVRADFPRQKKNKLSKEQVKLNEELAEVYNKNGEFPYTLVVNEKGKVLKIWDGYPNISAARFVEEIKLLKGD